MENVLKEINFLANSKGVDGWIRDRLQALYRAVRTVLTEYKPLHAYTDAEISAECSRRMMAKLGDQSVGVSSDLK